MNERQLNSYISTVDLGSFSKAAKLQDISVPALVQQIDLLEESLGFKLLRRTTHGVKLTEAGADFYNDAKEILNIFYGAKEKHMPKKQIFTIGYETKQTPDFLPDAVNAFSKKHKELEVMTVEATYDRLVAMINREEINCALIPEPNEVAGAGGYFDSLFEDTYSFVVPMDHPIASKLFVEERDLKNRDVLCRTSITMKQTYKDGLSNTAAILHEVTDFVPLEDKDMFVIHAAYESSYTDYSVVGSTLEAGSFGVYRTRNNTDIEKEFVEYLKERI